MHLAHYKITPPEEWMYNSDELNSLIHKIPKPITETEELVDTCVVCLEYGELKFVKTKCFPHHLICKECYYKMFNRGMFNCPYCRKWNALS